MICAVVSYLLPFHACDDVLCCRFQALYNYMPQNEDELELQEGDLVSVMEKCDDGWFVGMCYWSLHWFIHYIISPILNPDSIYYRALFWSCMFSFYLYPDSYVCTGFSVQVHPRGQNSSALSQEIMWKLLICDPIHLKKLWVVWRIYNTMLKQPDPFETSNEDVFSPAKLALFQMNVQVCDQ